MKLFLRLLLLEAFVFLAVILSAQPTTDSYAPTADESKLLWKITGDDLDVPSYLYGTIHMIPAENFFLADATKMAFDGSARVAFEIDTEAMTNPMAMMGLMNKMYMANDTTLADLLTAEEYKLVEDHFNEIGMPLSFLARIKPMFLSMMAGEDMQQMQQDAKENGGGMGGLFGSMGGNVKSYEMEFTSMAKDAEKPIVGLETAEFQISLFDSIPYAVQAQMLVETVEAEDTGEGDDMMDRMIELYTNQDIVGMQSMMGEDENIADYEELLLLTRNRNWIPVMEDLMGEEQVFFAVGAGHLAGEEGVVALLRKAGYTVTPMD